MAEPTESPATTTTPSAASEAPKRRRRTTDAPSKPAEKSAAAPTGAAAAPKPKKDDDEEERRAPRRATLPADLKLLLATRGYLDDKRPLFVRQAAHRYGRIGRDESWRRPRGLQSKQRRHYGYRSKIVRVGYRSPAAVRGLTPAGFRPVLVRTRDELDGLDALRDAAVIARTVGTRRRLVLEEEARRLGIRVLNPIVKPGEES
jgi:large subunit ribosomal protein L32e